MIRRSFLPLAIAFLCCLCAGTAAQCADVDYLRDVKSVLAARCYSCHGALKQEAGLRLDTAEAIRTGGESGAAVVAGDVAQSVLIERVTDPNPDTRMPPESEGTPLKAEEIAAIRAWIEQGAVGPADEKPEADPREHWAFRPVIRPDVPKSQRSEWVRNAVDAFVAAEHDRQGLVPQSPADKRILLRRVYLDLIGLPPTREQIEAFVADDAPDAYEQVVETLLKSPQYGERWGRNWMDVWRYSDWWGLGAEVRNSQKHIWHWRDWIIESLNNDVGYDEMLRQMLAADELYPTDLDKVRATGFLARHYFKFNRNTWLDETVEHTSKAFLGLTFNCAKCHDHKYDPIEQRDYYRLRAFFEPYQVRTDQVVGQTDFEQDGIPRAFDCNLDTPTYLFVRGDEKRPNKEEPLSPALPELLLRDKLTIEAVVLPAEAHRTGLRPWVVENYRVETDKQLASARAAFDQAKLKFEEAEAANSGAGGSTAAVDVARLTLTSAEKSVAAAVSTLVALEQRAEADRLLAAGTTSDQFKQAATAAAQAERQLALANAAQSVAQAELSVATAEPAKKAEAEKKLAEARTALESATKAAAETSDAYTPLRGSLKTLESNLETTESRDKPFPRTSTGRRTALARWVSDPRNPLTARVAVNHIWMRHFNSPLVPTVSDFGRKGIPPTNPALLDWLAAEFMDNGWSMKHVHRLMVLSNTYRMSSSTIGGEQNVAIDPENRAYWRMNPRRMEAQMVRDSLLHLAGDLDPKMGGPPVPAASEEFSHRRSMYFFQSHNEHHRFLEIFDDANVLDCYRRDVSIVPQQALALSNSRQAIEAANRIATRLNTIPENAPDDAFIRAAFLTVLATEPTAEEQQVCAEAMKQWAQAATNAGDATLRARANLVQTLINHNDFVTVR